MKTQVLRLSKTNAIINCCIITFCIAAVVCLIGQVDLREFMNNILAWDSI